ncbi:MAG: ShlB/FhaC/HecB family hemolysin secretion/activation protein [Rickettsiales bacterium]|nr:ShlB/FhaC/HecB family hemolysin secretion/activation protein [Rickettsiales bacterium]
MCKITSQTRLFLLVWIVFFINISSHAQNTQNSIQKQNRTIRDQQQLQEEQRRQKEIKTLNKERQRLIEKEKTDQFNNTKESQNDEHCFHINKIKLKGANLLSIKKKITLTKPFISKCFSPATLSKISSVITNYYIKKGYTTTQVSISQQNIANGILIIDVIEGKISSVTLNDDSLDDRMQKFMAFGNIEDETLDIDVINQGIYQINRIKFNEAKLKIKPAKKVGYSDVVIENNRKFPAKIGVTYNNHGNEFTGVKLGSVVGVFANLLSLNDEINVGLISNVSDDSKKKDLKSFYFDFSVPFQYYTLLYNYSRTEFKGTEIGTQTPLTLTGYSEDSKLSLEKVLNPDVNNRIAIDTSLLVRKTASYLNQQKIETSERKLSILNVSFSIAKYFTNGINLYLKPSYSRGLKILNANKDPAGRAADIPAAQFQSYKLYTSLSKEFIIAKIPFLAISEFNGQIAKDTLFGSEHISVGGYYSVRGYRENFIAGDHGFYSRNSLSFDLKYFLPTLKETSSALLTNSYQYLNRISIKPFYDYGMVRSKFSSNNGRMSGAGMEVIINRDKDSSFEASLTLSKGLSRSNLSTTNRREDYLIYFDVKLRLF